MNATMARGWQAERGWLRIGASEFCLLLCLALTGTALGEGRPDAVPQMINYQGRLTGSSDALADITQVDLVFSIFTEQSGGVVLWGPESFAGVQVTKGMFNVILGPKDDGQRPIARALSNPDCYLQVTVGGQVLQPRSRILSGPYALYSGNDVPIGGIIAWNPPVSVTTLEETEAALPVGFAVCKANAQDDPNTFFDETRIPNLLDDRFLRGSTPDKAGQAGGSNTHVHNMSGGTDTTPNWVSRRYFASGAPRFYQNNHTHSINAPTNGGSSIPACSSVIYIIRVK